MRYIERRPVFSSVVVPLTPSVPVITGCFRIRTNHLMLVHNRTNYSISIFLPFFWEDGRMGERRILYIPGEHTCLNASQVQYRSVASYGFLIQQCCFSYLSLYSWEFICISLNIPNEWFQRSSIPEQLSVKYYHPLHPIDDDEFHLHRPSDLTHVLVLPESCMHVYLAHGYQHEPHGCPHLIVPINQLKYSERNAASIELNWVSIESLIRYQPIFSKSNWHRALTI